MRGSILCSLFLWIPAYARMTGESLRNPGPELAEGRPAALISLRTWRLCGKSSFLLLFPCHSVANAFFFFLSVFFRVIPWLMLLPIVQPSLTLPALISVFVRGKNVFFSSYPCFCFCFFRVFPCSSVANASAFSAVSFRANSSAFSAYFSSPPNQKATS